MDARVKAWIAIGVAIAIMVVGFGAWSAYELGRGAQPSVSGDMGGMDAAGAPRLPPVAGYYDDERILFIHTEASDSKVAGMLTDMMDSPVLVVPELAHVPDTALAKVFVFTNGVMPDGPAGPFGYQPDVFDSAPSDPGYRPLREVSLVTWRAEAQPRTLTSADQIEQARVSGEIRAEQSGIVVNMPFVRWPGGER